MKDARHKPTAPLLAKSKGKETKKNEERCKVDLLLNHHDHKQQPLQQQQQGGQGPSNKHETNKDQIIIINKSEIEK